MKTIKVTSLEYCRILSALYDAHLYQVDLASVWQHCRPCKPFTIAIKNAKKYAKLRGKLVYMEMKEWKGKS